MSFGNVFSINTLTENIMVKPFTSISTIQNEINSHRSYFSEALDFVREIDNELLIANKSMYKSLLESGNNRYFIHESFEGFFETIKNIIKKVIKFIRSIFDKFIVSIARLFKIKSYLKNHFKELEKFNKDNEFVWSGYEYTINTNIPTTEVLENFANSIESISFGNNQKITAATTKSKYDALSDSLDEWYDKARAKVLNEDGAYSEAEYAEVLFAKFRNDMNSATEINIDFSFINDAIRRFNDKDRVLKETKNNKTRIEEKYKKIEDAFDKGIAKLSNTKYIAKYSGRTLELEDDAVNYFDMWTKAKANQIHQLSNIHTLAFAAKIDAIRECYTQDVNILYKALYKVQGEA